MIPLQNRFGQTKTSLTLAVNELLLKNRKLKQLGIAALLGVSQAKVSAAKTFAAPRFERAAADGEVLSTMPRPDLQHCCFSTKLQP